MLPISEITQKTINILLAEDSPDDAFFFRRALLKSGAKVDLQIVKDGRQAIDYLTHEGAFARTILPDIFFLDLKMPHVNGFEVLEWMNANLRRHRKSRIPVVILSSSDEPADRSRAQALGVSAYFIKPIKAEDICNQLTLIENH